MCVVCVLCVEVLCVEVLCVEVLCVEVNEVDRRNSIFRGLLSLHVEYLRHFHYKIQFI